MSRKILETIWASNKGVCGFIITRDTITKEIKTYFSHVDGKDKEEDIKYILDWGQKISETQMKSFFEKYFKDR